MGTNEAPEGLGVLEEGCLGGMATWGAQDLQQLGGQSANWAAKPCMGKEDVDEDQRREADADYAIVTHMSQYNFNTDSFEHVMFKFEFGLACGHP